MTPKEKAMNFIKNYGDIGFMKTDETVTVIHAEKAVDIAIKEQKKIMAEAIRQNQAYDVKKKREEQARWDWLEATLMATPAPHELGSASGDLMKSMALNLVKEARKR